MDIFYLTTRLRIAGLMAILLSAPAWLAAQCGAPVFSTQTVTGTNSATLCWTSAQGDVANHKWNIKVNDISAGVTAALDVEVAGGSPGLTITPGSPVQVCYVLNLPKAGNQYQALVAEQCDGPVASLSPATTMPVFTTNAAAPETPAMPTQFKTINQSVTHTATFNDISLDPTPLVGAPSRVQFTRDLLGDVDDFASPNAGTNILFQIIENLLGVDIPDWVTGFGVGLGDLGGFYINPTLQFGVTADYGGYMGLKSIGTADVNVTYPVNITLQAPADQQFGCGDKIVVETAAQRGSGAQVAITPAFYETEMGPILDNVSFVLRIGLTATVEFGCDPLFDLGCLYSDSWDLLDVLGIPGGELLNIPIPIGGDLPPFIVLCEDAFEPGANLGTIFDCAAGTSILQQIVGLVNTSPNAGPILDNMFDGNATMVEISNPDIPSAVDLTIPEFSGTFKKLTSSNLTQTFNDDNVIVRATGGEFEELSRLRLDLISLIDYFGYPTSVSLGGGLGEVDFGDLNLNLTTDLELNYTFDPTFKANINLGQPMNWRVFNPGTNATVATGFSQIVPNVLMGNHIEINIPNNFESTATINEEFLMEATMTTLNKLHYNNSLSIELFQLSGPGVDFAIIPEFQIVENEMPGSPKTIEDHTLSWGQNSFSKPTRSFDIVPDQTNPVAVCKPHTVVLNQWGTASILPSDVFNSTASYDLPSTGTGQVRVVSVSPNTFNCVNISGVVATLTIEDRNCNQSTCTANVTVVDNSAPQIDCPDNFVIENDFRQCGAVVTVPVPAVFDNCSYGLLARYQEVDENNNAIGPWSTWVANPSGYFAVGRWKIQWEAKDPSNNSQSCTFFFDVIDTEKPVIQCFNPTYVFNGQPHLDLVLSDFTSATDNCQMANLSINLDKIYCQQLGDVLTITATAVDIYNNTITCTSTLTIDGLPCGWSQQPDGVNCDDGNSATYNVPSQVFTLNSEDCFYASPFTQDETAFVQRTLCGNGSLTAQVTSIGGNAFGWAGIVMRESNAGGSKKVQLTTNMGSSLSRREVRFTTNGQAQPQQFPGQGRNWLRLVRNGDQFVGYTSANGVQWNQVMAATVSMNSCIQMGLVSTNYEQVSVVSSTFANVGYTGASSLGSTGGGGTFLAQAPGATEVELYPNPAMDEVNITLPGYAGKSLQITVYNNVGQAVIVREIDEVQDAAERLSLRELANGVYFVTVRSEGIPAQTQKLIIGAPRP